MESLQANVVESEHARAALTTYASVQVKVHGRLELADALAVHPRLMTTHWSWHQGGVQSCSTMLTSELFIRIPLQS